jgi:uncharacterized protein with PQ loop repeat
MKVYRHSTFGKIIVIIFKLAATLVLLISTFPMLPFAVKVIQEKELPGVVCYVFAFSVIGWLVALVFFNFYPEVVTDEQGIRISFMFSWVRILWQDVIDIGAGHPPAGTTLVRARKITPAHILYGWIFAYSSFPAFLIGRTVNDRDDLIKQINRHLATGGLTR